MRVPKTPRRSTVAAAPSKASAHLALLAALTFTMGACRSDDDAPLVVKRTKNTIVFAVPFAPVAYPMLKMLDDGALARDGMRTKLVVWKTPGQLKALVAGGQADFFAVPSNTAAMFYNRGIKVKLLSISIWRAIWIVSRSPKKRTLADFKGEAIAMPFKGDMPHLIFMALARKQGLDPNRDFKLHYVPSPIDAAQKLILRRVDHALLIDPAVSMVLHKSSSGLVGVIAPKLYRSVDLQGEWARLFGTKPELPFAGIMAGARVTAKPALVRRFVAAYERATRWCVAHPEETAKMAVKHIPQLNVSAVIKAMRAVTLKAVPAKQARPRLEAFFKVLSAKRPAVIGGRLPAAGFYYDEATP